MLIYRGDQFRTAFADIGELRSALPNVPVLVATATATRTTYDCVVQRLLMQNVHLVGLSPNRNNIFLSVVPSESMDCFVKGISEEIKTQHTNFPKSVIFCRSYNDCNKMYDNFERALDVFITYPPGYPFTIKYRLVDLYTRASLLKKKVNILNEFTKIESVLRLVICTTAFGMGIDCPDIRRVYHWGPPCTLEEYVQEAGRAGRDCEPCSATLIYNKPRNISEEMQYYGRNRKECRRQLLYKNFMFHDQSSLDTCMCCDVCNMVSG